MKIGVTGTRNGMNEKQKENVKQYLTDILVVTSITKYELHHGDCIGVDVEVANIAQELGYKIINYPPIEDSLRAFHKSDISLEPKTYFARNRNIVNNTAVLLVVPREDSHQQKGGTWYTYDYAKKHNKCILIFYPNGTINYPPIQDSLRALD